MLEVGAIIGGKFRVDRILGEGGMGVVAVATHLQLEQPVALKVLREPVNGSDDVVERFLREARASARLRSEHVCKVSDVGQLEDGAPYLVMELLEGSDLAAVIARSTLSVETAVEYVLQACVAIAEAHALGIVHRDLKPANLFLTKKIDGSPLIKVLDFGIAKAASTSDFKITRTSTIMGSPGYMSPEQLRSARDADARSDIWAIGVILYEMVSGRLPFEGESITELAVKVVVDPPAPLGVDAPALWAIIERCLAKTPDQRYPNVAALAADLAQLGGEAARRTATMIAALGLPVSASGPAMAMPASASSAGTMPAAAGLVAAMAGTMPASASASLGLAPTLPPEASGGLATGARIASAGASSPGASVVAPGAATSAPIVARGAPTQATTTGERAPGDRITEARASGASVTSGTSVTSGAATTSGTATTSGASATGGMATTGDKATTLDAAASQASAPAAPRKRWALSLALVGAAAVAAGAVVWATRAPSADSTAAGSSAVPTPPAVGSGAPAVPSPPIAAPPTPPAPSTANVETPGARQPATPPSDFHAGSDEGDVIIDEDDELPLKQLMPKLDALAKKQDWLAVLQFADAGDEDPSIAKLVASAKGKYLAQQMRAIDAQVKTGQCALAKQLAAMAHEMLPDDATLEARAAMCKPKAAPAAPAAPGPIAPPAPPAPAASPDEDHEAHAARDATIAQAQAAARSGDWERTLELSRDLLSTNKRLPQALVLAVSAACHLGDAKTARQLLRRLSPLRQRPLRQLCIAQGLDLN